MLGFWTKKAAEHRNGYPRRRLKYVLREMLSREAYFKMFQRTTILATKIKPILVIF